MKEFEELCEKFGIMQTTKRMMYPRQIKLSEEFLRALKDEYYRQKLEEDVEAPVKNRPEKFLKALRFQIKELEDNSAQELEAYRRMMDEDTEPYVAKTEGETVGNTEVNASAEEKRRREVEIENMQGPDQESVSDKNLQPKKRIKKK